MISFCSPLPIGNAIRILLAPLPTGAVEVRLLRKTADTISGATDPDAGVVYEGDELYVVDTTTLLNGTPYFYRAYTFDGVDWTAFGPSATATPAATGGLRGPDPLTVLRERLEVGLKAEVVSGRIPHDLGYVPCLTAPPQFEGTKFPVVTIHLRDDSPAVRGLGEDVGGQIFDEADDDWKFSEGWLSRYNFDIVSWVVGNPDVRIALRTAIKKVLLGNLPVFKAAGMDQIEFSQTDTEDFESYGTPIYQTMTPLTCVAPSVVDGVEPAVDDVNVFAVAA